MAYRKRTLRTMSPTTRKVARLAGELDSVSRRLKNMIPCLQELDLISTAYHIKKNIKEQDARLPHPTQLDFGCVDTICDRNRDRQDAAKEQR